MSSQIKNLTDVLSAQYERDVCFLLGGGVLLQVLVL